MNHLRKEKNCLNCGAEISGRYCSNCGQENLIPKETTGHLIQHFISDLTHYDSKFLTSIRFLLFKPGFLTKEYLKGRRIRYLNPVRMYVFISFLFFLVLFAQKTRETNSEKHIAGTQNLNTAKQMLADSLKKTIQNRQSLSYESNVRDSIIRDIALNLDTPVLPAIKDESIAFAVSPRGFMFTLVETRYENIPEYDSAQKALPAKERDGFIGGLFIRKLISLKKELGSSSQISVNEEFQHNVPRLMFVLLPIFALLLRLFYFKNKSTYAAHVIFSIHYHSFAFLLLLAMNLVNLILPVYSFNVVVFFVSVFFLVLYLLIALKNVYGQSFLISTIKALSISILYIILLIVCLLIWALLIFFTA